MKFLSDEEEEEAAQSERIADRRLANKEEESEEEDDPFFLPLGIPHLVPGRKYLPDDPEWREFVKISNEKEKLMEIEGM